MDPGFKIVKTLEFEYMALKKKSSFLKYPQHKRSSRLCLIAADRDSLKDLKNQVVHSHSLESIRSKKIQIMNCTDDTDFPIEYKLNRSQKNQKDLSLGKIIIRKSSRIRERNDSPVKVISSEMFSVSNGPDEADLYWTRKAKPQTPDNMSELNPGYSTQNRSHIIELSYFATNPNGNIFGDLDSAPKKFFQEKGPAEQKKPSKTMQRESQVPPVAKTSLSELSRGSDRMIQDFLDRQIQRRGGQRQSYGSIRFRAKKSPDSINLSIGKDPSQQMNSLRLQDEKESTGFTFNIFNNHNIVKSEIFDTEKKNNIFLNFESEQQNDNRSPFFLSEFEKGPAKSYKSISKRHANRESLTLKVKKNGTRKKLKMMKTPKREKIFEKTKIKSKTQVLEKRYIKSNKKAAKKKKELRKKNFGIGRHSVNLKPKMSVKEAFKLKMSRKKKRKSKKKEKFEQNEYNKTLPVNKMNARALVSSRQFKRSGVRHQRTLSGVTRLVGNLNPSRKPKDKPNRALKKQELTGHLYLKRGKSKSSRTQPKKILQISTKKPKPRKVSRKKAKMIETPIFKHSLKKLTFDRPF